MNDVLGDHIGRRSLGAENAGDRRGRLLASADLQILVNDIQSVHLLPLVLMQPLDLDIKNGFRVDGHAFLFLNAGSKRLFIAHLNLPELFQKLLVILIFQELLQLLRVLVKSGSDRFRDQLCQRSVAGQQPSAEGNAVGLIVEFFRINLIKRMQLRILQDLRVDRRHAVYGKAVMDIHMRHMDAVVLINDIHGGIAEFLLHPSVQLLDDGHQLGHRLFQIGKRPLLQRLRQNGMIGVGAGTAHHADCLIHGKCLVLHQNPDQLRNDHGRMGIVDLNDRELIQMAQVIMLLLHFLQNELRGIAHHKILLINAQQISRLIGIIRIEEQGQVLIHRRLVKGDAFLHQSLVHRFQIEQTKLVHAAVIADHIDVVQSGRHPAVTEKHIKADVCLRKPRLRLDPHILLGGLKPIRKFLMEQPEMIIQPDPLSGKSQRGNGIHEAGGQPSETTVSQRRLRLRVLDPRHIFSVRLQNGIHLVVNTQIDQVVGKQLPDQKFRRNIIYLLFSVNGDRSLHHALHQIQDHMIKLPVRALLQAFPKGLVSQADHFLLHFYFQDFPLKRIHYCHSILPFRIQFSTS